MTRCDVLKRFFNRALAQGLGHDGVTNLERIAYRIELDLLPHLAHGWQRRRWYMTEAARQNWSTRVLDRQIGMLYYERLLVTQERAAVG